MPASIQPPPGSPGDERFYSARSSRMGSRHVVNGEADYKFTLANNLTCDPEPQTALAPASVLGLGKHRKQSMKQSDPKTSRPTSETNAKQSPFVWKRLRKCSCDVGGDLEIYGQSAGQPSKSVTVRQPSIPDACNTPHSAPRGNSTNPSEETENIVEDIKAYLSLRRHRACGAVPGTRAQTCRPTPRPSLAPLSGADTTRAQPNEAVDIYLLSTNDIAEILDIVIDGLRALHDKHLSTGCLSTLAPNHTRPRAGTYRKGIFPQCSRFADPATTISSVKSAFSAEGYVKDHTPRNNKATIISRQSITECNYDVSGVCPVEFDSTYLKSPWQVRRPSSTPLPRKQSMIEGDNMPASEPDIVSFPPLRPRSCTNDWIAPQSELENLRPDSQRTPTLYQYGVDAHRGDTPSPEIERRSSISNTALPGSTTSSRTSPTESPGNSGKKRMGSSIGIASHRRKSTVQQLDPQPDPQPDLQSDLQPDLPDQSPDTALLDRLRRYSLMPLLDHTPEVLRKKKVVSKLVEDVPLTGKRRMSSRAMLEDILAKAPSQGSGSRNNSSSNRLSKTSRKVSKRSSGSSGYRRLYCLEDSVPHICVDEQPTPITERSLEEILR
ncbi:hypothetical protein PG985_001091 [Apiospora marii]|uniref:uncharacterized protein n=1 Tax=Apiospora marii TaxID=335849 RepID=UPI00312E9FC7